MRKLATQTQTHGGIRAGLLLPQWLALPQWLPLPLRLPLPREPALQLRTRQPGKSRGRCISANHVFVEYTYLRYLRVVRRSVYLQPIGCADQLVLFMFQSRNEFLFTPVYPGTGGVSGTVRMNVVKPCLNFWKLGSTVRLLGMMFQRRGPCTANEAS